MTEDLHVVYRGYGGSDTSKPAMVLLETPGGTVLGPLQQWVKHSPSGFAWGYNGSGPAELARCLLLDAVGEKGRACPECAGSRMVRIKPDGSTAPAPAFAERLDPDADEPADPLPDDVGPCWECDDGLVRLPYQDFKRDVVAGWTGDTFTIERWQILAWLATHQHERTTP